MKLNLDSQTQLIKFPQHLNEANGCVTHIYFMKKIQCVLLILMFFASTICNSQSLNETELWLEQNIEMYSDDNYIYRLIFKDTKVIIDEQFTKKFDEGSPIGWRIKWCVDFKYLEKIEIKKQKSQNEKGTNYILIFYCKPDKLCICCDEETKCPDTEQWIYLKHTLSKEDMLLRLKKAFDHLFELNSLNIDVITAKDTF